MRRKGESGWKVGWSYRGDREKRGLGTEKEVEP